MNIKTKDFAQSQPFQQKLQHHCYQLWIWQSFITSPPITVLCKKNANEFRRVYNYDQHCSRLKTYCIKQFVGWHLTTNSDNSGTILQCSRFLCCSIWMQVVSMTRVIEVSHWGNVAVEETYHMKHVGAELKVMTKMKYPIFFLFW